MWTFAEAIATYFGDIQLVLGKGAATDPKRPSREGPTGAVSKLANISKMSIDPLSVTRKLVVAFNEQDWNTLPTDVTKFFQRRKYLQD